jgi:two-component system, chemotaxis family, CheB/CheR fusion protein
MPSKTANELLAKSAAFFHGIIDTVREPLLVLDTEQRVVAANESFLSTFEVASEQTVNRKLYELGNSQWNMPALRMLLERVLPKEEAVADFEVSHDFETVGPERCC